MASEEERTQNHNPVMIRKIISIKNVGRFENCCWRGGAQFESMTLIGREILRAQKAKGWGTKVVERLAKDLAAEFLEMSGFSRGNLLFMRSFYAAWEAVEIVSQPVSKLEDTLRNRSRCCRGARILSCCTSSKNPPRASGMRARLWSTDGVARC